MKGKLKRNEQLARHTSFRVGGTAQYWAEPRDISDLEKLVVYARDRRIPLRVIGAGSNILVDHRGVRGIVVKLNSPCFRKINYAFWDSSVSTHNKGYRFFAVGAGISLARLIRFVYDSGFSGCELLAGIPGTLGGALVMNSGWIGRSVVDVLVMDKQGRIKTLNNKKIRFAYRSSGLKNFIILSANLKLIKKNKSIVRKRIKQYLNYRRQTQDLTRPSAGCIFKNPAAGKARRSAAYFIEQCGLKGSCIGDAVVSSKHANFIVNTGKATYSDIRKLITYVAGNVKKKFKISLQPEIEIWK
ncbi:UDP-N-acetylmuramate dehydrogenase [Candidatus Omnitrophota bacterium]